MSEPRKQVLCVDDEPDIPYRLKNLVERRYPIDVFIAENSKDALALLEKQSFDVVVTDVNMPGMSGLDLTAHIILNYPKTIVIIITGSGEHESLMRARGMRFLMKPLQWPDFQHLILEVFGYLPS